MRARKTHLAEVDAHEDVVCVPGNKGADSRSSNVCAHHQVAQEDPRADELLTRVTVGRRKRKKATKNTCGCGRRCDAAGTPLVSPHENAAGCGAKTCVMTPWLEWSGNQTGVVQHKHHASPPPDERACNAHTVVAFP